MAAFRTHPCKSSCQQQQQKMCGILSAMEKKQNVLAATNGGRILIL